jgi:hypothetical protein
LSPALLEGVVEMSIREKKGIQRLICNAAVLFLIGMFVFAQQVSSESVFDDGRALQIRDPVLDSPDLSAQDSVATPVDTMEVYDLMYDEGDGRNLYKEIAVFAIVAAAVGYFVVTLIKPDDEEVTTDGGKEPPISPALSVSVPLSR